MNISKEVKVGLLAVIALTILYFGFNYLKGIEFLKPTKTYLAVYDNVAGLSVANSVTINGFAVGRVSEIKIMQNRDNKILVAIDLNKEIVLGDSSVAFLTSDFLGSTSIDLRLGNNLRPLEDGDTLIGQLDKGIAEILQESAVSVGDNLQLTIRRINTILDSLSGSTNNIKTSLDNLAFISTDLRQIIHTNKDSIPKILENTNNLISDMRARIRSLKPIVDKFDQLADSLNDLSLSETVNRANITLENLNLALERVNSGQGTIGKLLVNDSLYNNMNKTLENLDKVLIHLDLDPNYFFAPLGKKKKKDKNNQK
ncbi:MAG: MlaD family protein [Bacteroidetes bacterium]|nr:MlaD family protein [Bacteroidota bacterium]